MITSRRARACRLEADWARTAARLDFRPFSHPLLMTESSLTRVVPPFSELAAVLARSKYPHFRNKRGFKYGLLNLLPAHIRFSNASLKLGVFQGFTALPHSPITTPPLSSNSPLTRRLAAKRCHQKADPLPARGHSPNALQAFTAPFSCPRREA